MVWEGRDPGRAPESSVLEWHQMFLATAATVSASRVSPRWWKRLTLTTGGGTAACCKNTALLRMLKSLMCESETLKEGCGGTDKKSAHAFPFTYVFRYVG